MKKILAILVLMISAGAIAATVIAPCTCAVAKATNGWCDRHALGYVANVEIRSKVLYETLDAHGHVLDLSTFACPSCRNAIESEGFCEEHRVGFVHGLAYFSRLTYELARAETSDTNKITCRICRKNAETHGWCPKCKLGRVGHFAIRDERAYQHVAKAVDILVAANEAVARCEMCAVAMVTDTTCPLCRITYKDGRATK